MQSLGLFWKNYYRLFPLQRPVVERRLFTKSERFTSPWKTTMAIAKLESTGAQNT